MPRIWHIIDPAAVLSAERDQRRAARGLSDVELAEGLQHGWATYETMSDRVQPSPSLAGRFWTALSGSPGFRFMVQWLPGLFLARFAGGELIPIPLPRTGAVELDEALTGVQILQDEVARRVRLRRKGVR